jgi:hypothetical protein
MAKKIAKCAKCKSDPRGGPIYIANGEIYHFCNNCDSILTSQTNAIIRLFLDGRLDLGQIDKDMIQARKARAEGKSLWKKPD